MNKYTYDIVIPVLNEEKRIQNGVDSIYKFLNINKFNNCKIVIADNGSTDGTAKIAVDLCIKYPNVTFLTVGERGVGLALKAAWGKSTADIVGYMDVDLATDLEHFKEVVEIFENSGVDIINGSRNLPSSEIFNRKYIRKITSQCFNFIFRNLLNTHISDGMCGFKFTRRDVYKYICMYEIRNNGWFFCAEYLYLAEKLGFTIKEIPITWRDGKDSKVSIIRLSYYFLLEIIRLRFRKI